MKGEPALLSLRQCVQPPLQARLIIGILAADCSHEGPLPRVQQLRQPRKAPNVQVGDQPHCRQGFGDVTGTRLRTWRCFRAVPSRGPVRVLQRAPKGLRRTVVVAGQNSRQAIHPATVVHLAEESGAAGGGSLRARGACEAHAQAFATRGKRRRLCQLAVEPRLTPPRQLHLKAHASVCNKDSHGQQKRRHEQQPAPGPARKA